MNQTPLFLAAENNNIKIIEYLLEQGVNQDRWTVNKVTPIMIAAIEGTFSLIAISLYCIRVSLK